MTRTARLEQSPVGTQRKEGKATSKKLVVIILGAFVVAGIASYGSAFDELIPTTVSLLKWGGHPMVGKLYKLVSKPLLGSQFSLPDCNTSNPIFSGGGLTVTMGGGTLVCSLQAADWTQRNTGGWRVIGSCDPLNPSKFKGYRYLNKAAPGNDPCRYINLKRNVIKVIAKKHVGSIISSPLNPSVAVELTVGNDRYCALEVPPYYRDTLELIKMRKQPEPLSCPSVTTTTTWLPPTTT